MCVALLCAASSTVLCPRQMYKSLHRLLPPQRYLHPCRCCLFGLGVSHAPHLIPHHLDLQEMAARASVAERLVVISLVLGMPLYNAPLGFPGSQSTSSVGNATAEGHWSVAPSARLDSACKAAHRVMKSTLQGAVERLVEARGV